jgi:hypothetical protein
VNVAEHEEAVAFRTAKVQGDPVKDPVAVPPFVNATVPRGDAGLVADVSLTIAVHVEAWLITTGPEHVTEVWVVWAWAPAVTGTERVVLLLPPKLSVAVKVTMKVVVVVGLNVWVAVIPVAVLAVPLAGSPKFHE